jgi:protein PhnA
LNANTNQNKAAKKVTFAQILVMEVRDSNGNILSEGDTVMPIKDLKLRGSSSVIKRGTVIKNIRLTDDPDEVEAKIGGSVIVLRTEFLKKK